LEGCAGEDSPGGAAYPDVPEGEQSGLEREDASDARGTPSPAGHSCGTFGVGSGAADSHGKSPGAERARTGAAEGPVVRCRRASACPIAERSFGDRTPAAGAGRVFNGDTIRIDGRTFRLWGIDAPELIQACQIDGRNYACGREAAAYLRTLLTPEPGSPADAPLPQVVCEVRVADQFGRPAAVCRVGELDLGAEMVRAGWALVFAPHGNDYAPQEAEARAALRGLWAGSFEAPWDWRARRQGE
jgi:endonuclease YncB( thermonuclease family)